MEVPDTLQQGLCLLFYIVADVEHQLTAVGEYQHQPLDDKAAAAAAEPAVDRLHPPVDPAQLGHGNAVPAKAGFPEDGGFSGVDVTFTSGDGAVYDSEGNAVDQMAPSAVTILRLMDTPELTSKGEWLAWFCGVFISVVTAVSILFADELFRWNLAFIIRNADRAEPSEWEIMGRYIGWTISFIMVPVIYILGLTT